ncbi:MAG: hypothetical protein AAGB28_19345, partial [Pseudomonadota bacterium]
MSRLLRALFARLPASHENSTVELSATETALAAALPEQGQLNIPVAQPGSEDTLGHEIIERGRDMARQDRWDALSAQIRAADDARAAAPDGMPIADLLAFGARSDVVLAAEHAL